jgi:hypothetical protein
MQAGGAGDVEAGRAREYIARSVDVVLDNYRRALLGMAPQVSSREDLVRFFSEYKEATDKATQQSQQAAGAEVPEADDDDEQSAPAPKTIDSTANTPQTAASAPQGTASAPQNAASAPQMATGISQRAAGERYAARFLDLKVRLEACTKGPISR